MKLHSRIAELLAYFAIVHGSLFMAAGTMLTSEPLNDADLAVLAADGLCADIALGVEPDAGNVHDITCIFCLDGIAGVTGTAVALRDLPVHRTHATTSTWPSPAAAQYAAHSARGPPLIS